MIYHLSRPESPSQTSNTMHKPKILWIDGVGSFAMCDHHEVTIGQAFPGNSVDLAIRGDLSRRAAIIRRIGEDHLLQPLQCVTLNGTEIDRATILSDGAIIGFGDRIAVRYVRPTQLSGTARLELLGHSRWQPLLTAALLLGESCVMGAEMNSHVVCPDWTGKMVLFRNGEQWMCRVSGQESIQVAGQEVRAPFPLLPGQRICGDEISMTLE